MSEFDEAADLIKLQVFHSRKEGVSYEEFVQKATEMMGEAVPIMKRHGVLHFSLTFSDDNQQKSMQDLIKATGRGDGWTVSSFDSVSTYILKNPEVMAAVQADPEWQSVVAERQLPWADMETVHLAVGNNKVFF